MSDIDPQVFESAKSSFLIGMEALGKLRYAEAETSFKKSLSLIPNRISTLINLVAALTKQEKFDEAMTYATSVRLLDPLAPELCLSISEIRVARGELHEALLELNKAIELRPDYVVALSNRAGLLLRLNQYDLALADLDKLVVIDPNFAQAYNHRGILKQAQKKWDSAIADYEKALSLDSRFPEALFNLGVAYSQTKRYNDAINTFQKCTYINPDTYWLPGVLLHTRMKICDWKSWSASVEGLLKQVNEQRSVTEPFPLLGIPAIPLQQQICAMRYTRDRIRFTGRPEIGSSQKAFGKKIRLAYISSDFYNHATAYLIADLFETHDRSRFEVIAVCYGRATQDEMRVRIFKGVDNFVEVADKSDAEIAEMLRGFGVNIAIDLKGHTQDSRLGIFAHRAAPVQVHYLGYPGTLGADFIDYLIADSILIPVEDREFYNEKIIYLPDTYQVNDRSRKIAVVADTRTSHGLPEHGFVYCCFNNNWKITPHIFDVWMSVLRQVDNSVLWLFEDNEDASANLRKEAFAGGISPDRLVFAKKLPLNEHLSRHRHADLFLDTLYYNAHTTASDALWAGLPLITKLGDTYASRVAGSLLYAMDAPELVVDSIEAYQSLALEFAQNPEKLAAIRQKLLDKRSTAALFDTPRFTNNLEKAYEAIWARYQAGLPPDHIHVQA